MKRQHPSAAASGAAYTPTIVRGCEKPQIRYSIGRLILDQAGECVIGFRTQFAFVWAEADVAKQFADSANDPKFRYIRA